MRKIFRTCFLFSLFCVFTFFSSISSCAAPPEEWHHVKTSLTSLKTGWSSNRHYAPPIKNEKSPLTNGCGLVHFELPAFFSSYAFDRTKIKIALSLTSYLLGDSIHPASGLEISTINPAWQVALGEKSEMTLRSRDYSKKFQMQAEAPNTWIAPIEKEDLRKMLQSFYQNNNVEIVLSSGDSMDLKFGHNKSVLENFQKCLAETKIADLPPLTPLTAKKS
ncbi:hypothetical protein FAI40_05295 [Acetobacteraceae bacterium]|nr:hypothetical protein FAI40_05295 [Acetobacteraceae bacterium]